MNTKQRAEYLIDFYDRFLAEDLENDGRKNHAMSPIEKILSAAICISRAPGLIYMCNEEKPNNTQWQTADRFYTSFFDRIILNYPCYVHEKIKYRVDIAIFSKCKTSEFKLAVECDGHDFHERTKEQAKHDKERDRWLQSNGWFVARFTGSEIYNEPFDVVDKIGEIVFEWSAEEWNRLAQQRGGSEKE